MTKSVNNQRRAGSPARVQTPVVLPTPPKSSAAVPSSSRRSSPRASSHQITKGSSPLRSPSLSAPSSPIKPDPAPKKRKSSVKMWSPVSEDVLCPICDDVCTCTAELSRDNGQGSGSGSASGWSSPIIIKDRKSHTGRVRNAAPSAAKPKASAVTSSAAKSTKKSPQSAAKNQRKERRLDRKADTMAQLVLSEYYFDNSSTEEDSGDEFVLMEMDEQSASDSADYFYSDSNSSSDLDEIIFELSESEDEETTRKMKELLMSKVNSVIGPNAVAWAGDSEDSDDSEQSRDDEPRLYLFDPTDAANLVVHLPLPSASQVDSEEEEKGFANLANLTPQVLAAISAASKTLTAATQHYTHNPTVPFSRGQDKQVAFVIEPETTSLNVTSASLRFDDLIDMSRLHGSSPPTPAAPMSQFMSKRWDRIPISSFRKRRLSVPRNVLPANAIKQPPPEFPSERFAQLHISEPSPLSRSPTDLLVVLEDDMSPTINTSGQRERRSTIQVTPGQAQIESLEEDLGYYWPMAGDEDLHWLGEHFRTNLA